MTVSNSRRRITVIASIEGVDRAGKALTRLGFASKTKFAEAQLLAGNAVTKFFNRRPMQLDTFQRVCEGLKLDWREILDSESKTESEQLLEARQPKVVAMSAAVTKQTEETISETARQITVLDHQRVVKTVIVLRGHIDSIDANFKSTLEVILKSYGGDTIEVIDIQAGSIRITIQGSEQDVERLRARITSGELTQINDFPIIEAFEILGKEPLDASKTPGTQTKWDLVQAIKAQPQQYRQLREIDLSDADLSDADLSNADLSDADLSNADLSNADLSGAVLIRANLSWAVLSNADLSNAVLIRADLSRADLGWADLSGALIDASTQLDPKWRLIHEIVNQGASGRDLRGTDLSRANLSRANLSRANLSRAVLSRADLGWADLSGANLSGANLSGAGLSEADLSGAVVQNAQFGEGTGFSQEEKQDLARRGAIFDDASGDRESAYSPTNR